MSPELRALTLTERVPLVCRLAPADVAFLLARHRRHVEVLPTGRAGRYRLTAAGHVGVVAAPTCRLVLQPKIPLRNVLYLLGPDVPPPGAPDAAAPVSGDEVLDFLAGQFAGLLAGLAAAGLHRGYAERAEQGPFLLGRLDVPAQLREGPGRKDQLHCRHDEFTADVACNQVPRAVAERLLASPLVGEAARAALRRALPALDGVTPVALTAEAVERAAPDRAPPGYRPLLELCRLLAEGLGPGGTAGPAAAPGFLLDMERVFERHVTRGVAEAFAGRAGWSVSVQPAHAVSRPAPGQPDVHMRPDVTVDREGGPVLVVDAKWKRLPRAALVTADLYQVLAYCTALGVGRAVLVYAGRCQRVWDYAFGRSPVRVTVRALPVAGSRAACARALRRLGQALRAAVR
jgi:5-methylcytosine-specific restriction enzyme subunit McrC